MGGGWVTMVVVVVVVVVIAIQVCGGQDLVGMGM
jgi:hypothetical protein